MPLVEKSWSQALLIGLRCFLLFLKNVLNSLHDLSPNTILFFEPLILIIFCFLFRCYLSVSTTFRVLTYLNSAYYLCLWLVVLVCLGQKFTVRKPSSTFVFSFLSDKNSPNFDPQIFNDANLCITFMVWPINTLVHSLFGIYCELTIFNILHLCQVIYRFTFGILTHIHTFCQLIFITVILTEVL